MSAVRCGPATVRTTSELQPMIRSGPWALGQRDPVESAHTRPRHVVVSSPGRALWPSARRWKDMRRREFTMPDTEDKAVVAHVREVADDVDKRLRALEPDLWIIFSNDHAEQFFHTTAPPFTVMWEAKRLANLPAGNSIGRFRARSPSSSCANFTGRISI